MAHSLSVQPSCSTSNLPPHQQFQSVFLILPAELRNEIYTLVFSTSTSSPHALSLLQTCRRIYTEAHLLAFSTVTFTTKVSVRYELARRTYHLSPAQFNAITNVAFAPNQTYENTYLLANFLANSISLFPRLKKATILVTNPVHVPANPWTVHTFYSPYPKQVPDWFGQAIYLFISGRPLAWQASELWTAEWPQQEGGGEQGKSYEARDLSEDGHEAQQAQWRTCFLKQKNESQRSVEVECRLVERLEETKHHIFRLREVEDADKKLPLRIVNGGSGLQWDGEIEWWVERKKKWKFFPGWRG